ncbi:hypothetical protein LCGC14_0488730 [marine sediment metagenome]|uniref:Uncharacterized protein n=1 Tax=marine sediment metagenome TaxID=412755 RepID=A0A0F9UU82_9ZZZZ
MKLHHTVNHTPIEERTDSIEFTGLMPQVADAYKDLVPEGIRHLPVVWLSEGIWQSQELPVFEVDSGDLDSDKLYPNAIVYEVDKDLHWWVYQGHIPRSRIIRLRISSSQPS